MTDPFFFLNADNKITLTDNNPEGEVKLSSISYGDLIDYESALGATIIKENFIKDIILPYLTRCKAVKTHLIHLEIEE